MRSMKRILFVSLVLGSTLLGGYRVFAGSAPDAALANAGCTPVACPATCDPADCPPGCGPADCPRR